MGFTNSGPVWVHIYATDDSLNELENSGEPLSSDGTGRINDKHQVHGSAAACRTKKFFWLIVKVKEKAPQNIR